jgi:hypothetical protein
MYLSNDEYKPLAVSADALEKVVAFMIENEINFVRATDEDSADGIVSLANDELAEWQPSWEESSC